MSEVEDKHRYWIGFDLGGTKMLAVVFDERLKPVARKRRKTRSADGGPVSLERLSETIVMALEEIGAGPDAIAGIGAGVPGPLDLQKEIGRAHV